MQIWPCAQTVLGQQAPYAQKVLDDQIWIKHFLSIWGLYTTNATECRVSSAHRVSVECPSSDRRVSSSNRRVSSSNRRVLSSVRRVSSSNCRVSSSVRRVLSIDRRVTVECPSSDHQVTVECHSMDTQSLPTIGRLQPRLSPSNLVITSHP